MRILLKIIAAPFVLILTVTGACLSFVFGFATWALNIVSGIAGLLGVVLLLTGQTSNGIIILILAFLFSPLGFPAIAGLILDRLSYLNYSLKNFIAS